MSFISIISDRNYISEMFTTHKQLKRKTPANGIDRKEYIGLLIDEFYETTDVEAKEQVSANLANFAYDPINYSHLREALTIQLFIELLSSSNSNLVRHGIAGLCNLCLDSECQQKILSLDGIRKISSVLKHPSVNCARDAIVTLLQMNSPETTELVFDQENVVVVNRLRNTTDIPLRNCVSLYLATAAKK